MNILVVHETEYIDKVVFEYQIIPEIWASSGHNVYVVDFPLWRKKNFLDFGSLMTAYKTGVKKANKKCGITLIRPGIIKIPVLSRIIAFFEYFYLFPHILKKYKIDVIFLYSVPTNGLQILFWTDRFNIPVHFRLLDVLHQLVPSKILSKPTYLLEKAVYEKVDELTAITPRLTRYAIKMGANKKTTSYLPSGSDSDLFKPRRKNRLLLKKYHIDKSDKVILFAGTLYNFSGLDTLLEYFGKNTKKYPDYKFLIVGHGEQEHRLKELIDCYNLRKNVILTGFIKYEKLADYINLADVCINPFKINKTTNIIFPGKIYQYLACSKPVIATRLKGIVDIFPDNSSKKHGIFYYDSQKPQELLSIIKKIRLKKIIDTNPSLQVIAKDLERRLKKLLRDS